MRIRSKYRFLFILWGFLAIAASLLVLFFGVFKILTNSAASPSVDLFAETLNQVQLICLPTQLTETDSNFNPSLESISPESNLLNVNNQGCNNLLDYSSQPTKASNIVFDSGQDSSNTTNPELAPWPQIHDNAKLAKVPVFMYHDIVAEKKVFFDVTPEELQAHFQLIQEQGLTPISLGLLIAHLRTGIPLPEKPILLTFDDGYGGHYQYVYPLLKQYGYPGVFSIYINKMTQKTGRTSVTWEQLKEMAIDPLVTIASHSVSHPEDLTQLSDEDLHKELWESKRILEENLGIPMPYFTYPAGKHDERVTKAVTDAGYRIAISMDDANEQFAGESPDLLAIGRFGQSRLAEIAPQAWGGYPLPRRDGGFNFTTAIHKQDFTVNDIRLILISGGIPHTIHADSRYQVPKIIEGSGAVAAVDGGFFNLKYLDSNVMVGPVLSQNNGEFVPGNRGENPLLNGRPLVLITPNSVKYVPFDAEKHNTLEGIKAEVFPGEILTDAFVAAAWLVKDSQPQPAETFANLYSFDVARNRAFWGINQAGQPVIGVTKDSIDSVRLGEILAQLNFREAIMVDSGASTSLAYQGESLIDNYQPRPVPHVVALFPSSISTPVSVSYAGLHCVLYEDSCQKLNVTAMQN